MTIDFWGLGLQAVNVLILVWLLSRVFWRPVAAAIATRQANAKAVIAAADGAQAKADAALAEATQARAGIADERLAALGAAKTEAEAASKAILAEARSKADDLLSAAKTAIAREAEIAQKANDAHASELSLKIAARLLQRMDGPAAQSAFLSGLVEAIAKMSDADRVALGASPGGIELVTAKDMGEARDAVMSAVQTALGGTPDLRIVTDPDLIAGLELRSPHLTLRNSWQADLMQVQKAVTDAA